MLMVFLRLPGLSMGLARQLSRHVNELLGHPEVTALVDRDADSNVVGELPQDRTSMAGTVHKPIVALGEIVGVHRPTTGRLHTGEVLTDT